MSNHSSLAIATPDITRDKHSLFALNTNAVKAWLGSLPLANLGEATRLLFQALSELSHTQCKPKDRYEILELIRPHVHHIVKGLSQHYLNKPVVLPEKTQKIVLLANTLNTQLATGYCQAFQNLENENRLLRSKDAMASCLHRALTEHSRILLRTYQLYRSSHSGFWITAHKIYQAALAHKTRKSKVSDSVYGDGTVQQAYLRLLMLGCSKTHQLPQRQIEEVYGELNNWAAYIELRVDKFESCVFLFNPTEDASPSYRELMQRAPAVGWLGINTKPLLSQSGGLARSVTPRKSSHTITLNKTIIDHLSIAWDSATSRTAERTPCNDPVLVTVGMNTTHFYVANQLDFQNFQFEHDHNEDSAERFQERRIKQAGSWNRADGKDTRDKETSVPVNYMSDSAMESISYSLPQSSSTTVSPDSKYEYLRTRILDSSSTGCRVEWPESTKLRIRTGELVGLKTDDYDSWRVGVVRWLRSDNSHQIGIEALASAATPYSARLIQAGLPVNEYQRAMLLPGGTIAKGPLLLLSGVVGISEGHTVELLRPGHAMRIKLGEMVEQSNAFKLFRFEDIARNPIKMDVPDADEVNNDDFNQLWDAL
ncbi:Uncharacterised protein [Zhongshania aliphaticivorans]|uniref:GTPase n=1 Tax=Zhongshania aliphaticivorans TaxID=1470434 RepID=A0A5S9MWS1_9GAMM|nr:hypothetical protein [Zhongshania aliphaticivorans]CAA0081771.1 Uncharacterised protein [Zhongshania aliphaticivorans]CAA0084767.1 Uncharacterised protein [Zhongshania aliphaticivorans]